MLSFSSGKDQNVLFLTFIYDIFIISVFAIGKGNVTLRYDPIFINEKYTLEKHIESFKYIANSLSDYTTEAIISFIDLYEKTKRNFPKTKEVNKDERLMIGKEFAKIGKENNILIKTCVRYRLKRLHDKRGN